jgi:hypothetical protein
MLRKRSVGYNRTDLPSLRRHYPGQVLRVLSQPSVAGKHPEESENLFGQRDRKDRDKKVLTACNIPASRFVPQQTALMTRISLLFCMMVALAATSYGQDKVIQDQNAEKRSVSGFHTIKVEDGVDLYLTQDGTEAVAVSAAKPEHRDKIKTTVENGVLRIYFDNENHINIMWRNRQLRAYVSVKTLKALRASGGSDVFIQSGLKADELSMHISGGSDFSGSITCNNLEVDASGGSDARMSGKVVNLKISASGGSDFLGYDLICDNVYVSASGGSDAKITVTKELGVEASGGSDVDYRGNAVIKYKHSSGGSSVSKRN